MAKTTRKRDETGIVFDIYEDEPWRQFANCRGCDPNLFFPERGATTNHLRQICDTCVVQDECLTYALDKRIQVGFWGGASERKRRLMRSARAKHEKNLITEQEMNERIQQLRVS